jgi:hypothetical protein
MTGQSDSAGWLATSGGAAVETAGRAWPFGEIAGREPFATAGRLARAFCRWRFRLVRALLMDDVDPLQTGNRQANRARRTRTG